MGEFSFSESVGPPEGLDFLGVTGDRSRDLLRDRKGVRQRVRVDRRDYRKR